jgi:hypothetical protein
MKKRQLLQHISLEKWLSAFRKMKLDPYLSPCTSVNSKWIKDLNIRPETLQLVHEKAIGIGKNFLSRIPATQPLKEKMDKWV